MIHIFIEKAGVISEDSIWVCIDSEGYLYTGATLWQLAWCVLTEWRKDKHLVG